MEKVYAIVGMILLVSSVFATVPNQNDANLFGDFFKDFGRGIQVFITDSIGSPVDKVNVRLDIMKEIETDRSAKAVAGGSTQTDDRKMNNLLMETSQKIFMLNKVEQSQVIPKIENHIAFMDNLKTMSPAQAATGLESDKIQLEQHLQKLEASVNVTTTVSSSVVTVNTWSLLTAEKATELCKANVDENCTCVISLNDAVAKYFTCTNGITEGTATCYSVTKQCLLSAVGVSKTVNIDDYLG